MHPRLPLSRTARIAAPALACLTVAALASPASAARPDSSSSVRSGERASVSWTELDPNDDLGLPGNTHVGQLFVEDGFFGSYASGFISDFDCAPGQVPGGHGDPGSCAPVGERFLFADGGELTVSGRTATFTGTLTVSNGGHGGPETPPPPPDAAPVSQPVPASITWSSATDLVRFRATNSYVERGISYRSRVTGLRSDAATTVVTGRLGRMGFADDPDDVSTGDFQSYTEVSRERMRTRTR